MTMKSVKESFWNASLDEIKKGYKKENEDLIFSCLFCGKKFEKGIIYPENDTYYEAERAMIHHIEKHHGSVLSSLIDMDKKYTGLTELQKTLIEMFSEGMNDISIVKELDGNSSSTIRNHRFALREREKQAKIFLAIMELMNEARNNPSKHVEVSENFKMVDDRFKITEAEREKYLKNAFKDGLDKPLTVFPAREKRKIVVLMEIIKRFKTGKKYSETEVNEILMKMWHDHVTLRRYLIEYGFMERTSDGSRYWVKEDTENL